VERVVLVHGSVTGGRPTWTAQRAGLRHRFDLVVLERPGFPPNPPAERIDFDEHADWVVAQLGEGDHLVGHSYGGVVSLLAAAQASERVASLVVIEPPCTRVALRNPDADRFADDGARWWAEGPTDDPEAFLRGFLRYVGSSYDPPSPLPPDLDQGARALIRERGPWYAEIPVETLAAAPFPKLAVSGAHHPAFDAICDALEQKIGAERLVFPGYGHAPQLHPDFNDALVAFVERAAFRPSRHRRDSTGSTPRPHT
jgi:pimeloyl-ACP methyl ester carboxylesterase